MNMLSDYLPDKQAIDLLRKAARRGDGASAYNMAITHLNRGDLTAYRHALAQAAKSNEDAAVELRQFKTRFTHSVMKRFRRLAPDRD